MLDYPFALKKPRFATLRPAQIPPPETRASFGQGHWGPVRDGAPRIGLERGSRMRVAVHENEASTTSRGSAVTRSSEVQAMLPRRPRDTPPAPHHHARVSANPANPASPANPPPLAFTHPVRVPPPQRTHYGSRACFKGGGESSLPSPLVPGLALQGWNTVDRASRTCPPTRAAVRYRPAPTPCLP